MVRHRAGLVVAGLACWFFGMGGAGRADDGQDAAWMAGLPESLAPALKAVWLPAPRLEGQGVVARLGVLATLGHRLHARRGLALDDAWLALMAWEPLGGLEAWRFQEGTHASHERGLEAFPVPDGRRDPVVDFAASVALAQLQPQRFACDFPLRMRFLLQRGLVHDDKAARVDVARCRGLKAWVEPTRVEAVELHYVAQRWQDAAASMGHVALRVRLKRNMEKGGDQSDPVVMWVARDAADTPFYLLKGLTGGLNAGVQFDTFGDVVMRYNLKEGRDIFVYELQLSEAEKLWLLADLAAMRGRPAGIAYAFFTENCATMLWKALRALMPELPTHAGWMFHPHEVASELLKHGRAAPREVLRSRKGRGLVGEAAREVLEAEMAAHGWLSDGAGALVGEMYGEPKERAAALRVLQLKVQRWWPTADAASADAERQRAWVAWIDKTLDIEAFAIDVAHGEIAGHLSSEPFEAALALRVAIPTPSPLVRTEVPVAPIRVSGSRRSHVMGGARSAAGNGSDVRGLLRWQTSVIDEEAGEARLVAFRRTARMRLLVNALTLSSNGSEHGIEENRLVVFESSDHGPGFRTNRSWFASRLGWTFGIESISRPREDLPFMLSIHGGPGLRIFGDMDMFDYAAIRLDFEGAFMVDRWQPEAFARAAGRIGLEGAVGLGSPEHRFRFAGFVGAAATPVGVVPEWSLLGGVDVTIDTTRGWSLRLDGIWRDGHVRGNGWEVMVGFAY